MHLSPVGEIRSRWWSVWVWFTATIHKTKQQQKKKTKSRNHRLCPCFFHTKTPFSLPTIANQTDKKTKKSSIIKWVLKQRHTVRCRQHHHETWNNLKGLCHVWFFQQGLGFWVWSIVFVPAQRPVVFIIHPQTKKRTMLTCPHIKTFWLYFWRSSTSLDISECLSVFFLGQTLKLQG